MTSESRNENRRSSAAGPSHQRLACSRTGTRKAAERVLIARALSPQRMTAASTHTRGFAKLGFDSVFLRSKPEAVHPETLKKPNPNNPNPVIVRFRPGERWGGLHSGACPGFRV